jgi:hypothetical protein
MAKKSLLVLSFVVCFGLTSCATLFKSKTVTIKTQSGDESGPVKIFERSKAAALVKPDDKGAMVFTGELPARVPVTISAGQFIVEYTDKDGKPATHIIKAAINPFLILDTSYLVGVIVDVVTGNIFSYHLSNKKIPISFQNRPETIHSTAWFVEGIPPQMMEQLVLIGRVTGE